MRRNLYLTILALLVGIFLFSPMQAKATLLTEGDPFEIGSWAQRFQEEGVGNYNRMEAFMITAGDAFEADGFVNLSAGGWSGSLVREDYIIAVGTTQNWMQFDIKFMGTSSNPLVFDFLAWEDSVLREAARATWNGCGWSFAAAPNGMQYDRAAAAVPEPATLLLLASGLIGLAGFGRKKLFQK
jgi:hypothetical protein